MDEISPAVYRAGSGEPLVLLHGFLGTWIHWRPVLAELVAGHEVIAPTLGGHHGGPAWPAQTPPTLEAAADRLELQLDELGVTSAHFAGNSMGGALAIEMAKRGRAISVVALAPGGGWDVGSGEPARLSRLFARQIGLTARLIDHLELALRRPSLRRLSFRDVMLHGELVDPSDAVAMARGADACAVKHTVVEALGRGGSDVALRDLERVAAPVLLVSPAHDRLLPPALHAPRLRRELPDVTSLLLPAAGHVPMWDAPGPVATTIRDWVASHSRRPALAAI
jgi:pimeloyl-ACP methyl ester carboxylesterase